MPFLLGIDNLFSRIRIGDTLEQCRFLNNWEQRRIQQLQLPRLLFVHIKQDKAGFVNKMKRSFGHSVPSPLTSERQNARQIT